MGVPQGGVFVTILFSFYMSRLTNTLDKALKMWTAIFFNENHFQLATSKSSDMLFIPWTKDFNVVLDVRIRIGGWRRIILTV